MPIDDVYQLTIDFQLENQNMSNVLHARQTTIDGAGAGEVVLGQIWEANLKDAYKNLLTTDVLVVQTRTRRILQTETQAFIDPINEFGASSPPTMPTHQAAVLRMYGEPEMRKGIGNQRISGFSSLAVESGRVTAGGAIFLNAYGALLADEWTQDGWSFRFGVFSRIDLICRDILKAGSTSRVKTVYSRQIGVGD